MAVPVKVSPSEKDVAVFDVPEFVYFTYKVSGSVPSVATVFTTSAVTPDVPPVKTIPLNEDSETPLSILDNFTA